MNIDWSKAPRGYNWHVYDPDGSGWWYTSKPTLFEYGWNITHSDDLDLRSTYKLESGDWRDSLEERPVSTKSSNSLFNLDKALSGHPVITREGKKVSDIFLIKSNTNPYPVVAVINSIAYTYSKEGKISVKEYPTSTDLIMAPVTQILNGYVVPRPITEPLSAGEQYFLPNVFYENWYDSHYWNNDCHDNTWLKRGLIFKTKEDAIAVAKAMIGLDPEKDHDN